MQIGAFFTSIPQCVLGAPCCWSCGHAGQAHAIVTRPVCNIIQSVTCLSYQSWCHAASTLHPMLQAVKRSHARQQLCTRVLSKLYLAGGMTTFLFASVCVSGIKARPSYYTCLSAVSAIFAIAVTIHMPAVVP